MNDAVSHDPRLAAVRRANATYLGLVRDMAREDINLAIIILGVSEAEAETIASMPNDKFADLCQMHVPLIALRGSKALWERIRSNNPDWRGLAIALNVGGVSA